MKICRLKVQSCAGLIISVWLFAQLLITANTVQNHSDGEQHRGNGGQFKLALTEWSACDSSLDLQSFLINGEELETPWLSPEKNHSDLEEHYDAKLSIGIFHNAWSKTISALNPDVLVSRAACTAFEVQQLFTFPQLPHHPFKERAQLRPNIDVENHETNDFFSRYSPADTYAILQRLCHATLVHRKTSSIISIFIIFRTPGLYLFGRPTSFPQLGVDDIPAQQNVVPATTHILSPFSVWQPVSSSEALSMHHANSQSPPLLPRPTNPRAFRSNWVHSSLTECNHMQARAFRTLYGIDDTQEDFNSQVSQTLFACMHPTLRAQCVSIFTLVTL